MGVEIWHNALLISDINSLIAILSLTPMGPGAGRGYWLRGFPFFQLPQFGVPYFPRGKPAVICYFEVVARTKPNPVAECTHG
jgi:hypothetical protein